MKDKNRDRRKADISRNNSIKQSRQGSGRRLASILAVLLICLAFFALSDNPAISGLRDRIIGSQPEKEYGEEDNSVGMAGSDAATLDPGDLPEYNGEHYVDVAGGLPAFPEDAFIRASLTRDSEPEGGAGNADIDVQADDLWYTEGSKPGVIEGSRLSPYEYYGELDDLGRCTAAYGCLGEETMPADGTERGDISKIHPSGWAKAQNWERSHLIAWALSDENANERNLVTGTHYLNHDGMRPLEEEVEHYIWNTGNHVLYMARPLFCGDELVPRGVQMTAWSCEDHGKGISFNVYCFNVTPGAEINYANGVVTTEEQASQAPRQYVVNIRSGVFHYPSCEGAKSIYKKNRMDVTATRKELTDQGYIPCGYCEP